MGNSNSSGGGGGHHRGHHHGGRNHHHPHHHNQSPQWTSHSLETPEQRNRMKRGYFPPRPYIGHPGLPQPQKVLPSSAIPAPSKLLKPTSNGAILHGGGTISGRKLSEMTDASSADRKRSTVSCPAVDYPLGGSIGGLSSGRSTPNLASVGLSGGHLIVSSSSGQHHHRNSGRPGSGSRGSYGSEPDLRDVGMLVEPCHPGNCPNLNNSNSRNHSPDDINGGMESPLPNSFTLISESPAKKQIRSRKKSKAPPPPQGSNMNNNQCCIPPEMMMNGGSYLISSNGHPIMPHYPNNMYPPMPQPYILQQRHFLSPGEMSSDGHNGNGHKGKKLRLFKTKAESKSAANSPAIRSPPSSELIFPLERPSSSSSTSQQLVFPIRGGPMRASLDANRLLVARNHNNNNNNLNHNEKDQHQHQSSRHHQQMNKVVASSSSQMIERESKGEMIRHQMNQKGSSSGRLSSSSSGPLCSPKDREQGVGGLTSSTDSNGNNNNKRLLMGSHEVQPSSSSSSVIVPPRLSSSSPSSSGLTNKQQPVPKNHVASRSPEQSKTKLNMKSKVGLKNEATNKSSSALLTPDHEKKTFYFGMDNNVMGTFKNQKDKQQQQLQLQLQQQQQQDKVTPAAAALLNEDLHKELSRRKMVKQIEEEIKQGVSNDKVPVGKKISINGNLKSESDSDGLHRRQDSGNFDMNDTKVHTKNASSNKGKNVINGNASKSPRRESSSDLSSSDLDVPLVVTRPTLPQKRPDLPRFSPTAAWRALESPSSRISMMSGRSYSSEDGLHGGNGTGKINGYVVRQSAPPLNHHQRHNRGSQERSGDSGISAGDAGSPAGNVNPNGDFSSSSPVLLDIIDDTDDLKVNKSIPVPGSVNNKLSSADRMMKCWVPEQDLDESSSDFEQEIIPPPIEIEAKGKSPVIPVISKTSRSSSSSRLFEGKRASAVVSDSDSKYFSSSGDPKQHQQYNNNVSSGDAGAPSRRFYSRSSKTTKTSGVISSSRLSSPGGNIVGNKFRKTSATNAPNSTAAGFVGLDTNWFLSRSEPNSLHVLGSSEVLGSSNNAPHREDVIVGRMSKKCTMIPKNERDDGEDEEFECELNLSDEEDEDESSDNNNNHNDFNNITSRNKRKKEIGYGPSSMNLPNPNNKRGSRNTNAKAKATTAGSYDSDEYEEEYDENKKKNKVLKPKKETDDDDEEDIEEELMRDDLFDYLDQYEEGEFEREQELSGSSAVQGMNFMNVSTATNGNFVKGDESKEGQKIRSTTTIPINSESSTNAISTTTTVVNKVKSNGNAAAATTASSASVQKFSHNIMYLPSYDSRRLANNNQSQFHHQRRARSVDHLDTGDSLFIRNRNNGYGSSPQGRQNNGDYIEESGGRGRSKVKKVRAPPPPNSKPKAIAVRKQSEPCFPSSSGEILLSNGNNAKVSAMSPEEQEEERRALNKKKFKFQSTLRVQERKKIEEELTKEARQREEERLREIEAMKRVEEEFQKKRAKEKMEAQEALLKMNNGANGNVSRIDLSVGGGMSPVVTGGGQMSPQRMSGNNSNSNKSSFPLGGRKKEALSHQPSTSSSNGSSSGGPNLMSKRQEPEGAPAAPNSLCNSSASVSGGSSGGGGGSDLRKELISASKKRNALVNGNSHHHSNSIHQGTQELSEYRQESSRQYCDYRSRPGRQQSLSPARFNPSSSSDIFPISSRRKGGAGSSYSGGSKMSGRSSTVHPEVVCDIPVKPTPYMVNASRLGGSTLNLVSEERPTSTLGSMNNLSSPSSVISDNYRKDWVHHHNSNGVVNNRGGVGGRASSVISLHSAPGYSSAASDLNFRNSTSDISRLHHQPSPRYLHEKSPANRQYSTSPPSSSPILRRDISEKSKKDKSSRSNPVKIMSRSNTTVISIGAPLPYRHMTSKKPSRDTSPFQSPHHPQPFMSKVKEYRPVPFKPNTSSTTAVN